MKKKLWVLLLIPLFVGLGLFIRFKRQSGIETVAPVRGLIIESVYGLGAVVSSHVYRQTFAVSLPLLQLYVREGQLVEKGTALLKTENGIVKAPFTGTVTSAPFKEGELIPPQASVITISDLNDVYIEVSLEQQGAMRVREGQTAQLSFENLRGQKIEGKVRSVFPKEGQFLVHIDSAKLPQGILIGMTADVAIEVGKKQDVLTVPISAVNNGKLLVERNGKKERIDVKVGIVDGEKAEILDDVVGPNDLIVIRKK